MPPEARVLAVAVGQWGVIAYRQLVASGLSRRWIEEAVRRRYLHPVHRGVFAVGRPDLTWKGRLMAAVLAAGSESAVSHRSAADLLSIRGQWRDGIDVSTPIRGRHHLPGIRVHTIRRLDPRDIAAIDGIPVTTLPRTLLDLADVLTDLELAHTVNAADRGGLLDVRTVEELIARSPGRRLRKLRRAIDSPQPPSRSEFVRRFLDLLTEHGLRLPLLEHQIGPYTVDACWPDARLVVELDDYATHGTRRTFESDRERDAALHALGYRVIRITWRQLGDGAAHALAVIGDAVGV